MCLLRSCIILCLIPCFAYAINPTAELSNLNKNITTIQIDLKKSTIQKSQLQTALTQTKTHEGKVHAQIQYTQQSLSQKQQTLEKLKQKTIPLEQEKIKYHTLLKQQIIAAYLFSQQPTVKLLLSSNDLTKTHRILMYYHYITAAQMLAIQHLQTAITTCENNQKEIQSQYKQLLTVKQRQLRNQQTLENAQTQRQQLIQTVNQQIKTKHAQLTELLWNKRQLEDTIRELNLASTKQFVSKKPLTHLHGKLPWPTQGTIRHAFGTSVEHSQLNWDGVVISAPIGQPVHAVASGRVIFAKWLAGYGLLLIVDDGNGYMTLYGRNQTLLEKVGDTIKTGGEIGTVGHSGGFLQPGLYFSIRHNGQALNPAIWLSKRML